MDQPEYQVFNEGKGAYRFMKYPLPIQKLHTIYPGRLMQRDWHYTGDNIPNEHPMELLRAREHQDALDIAAEMETEAIERHLGGKDKVIRHPAVEPEAPIEDPTLRGLIFERDPSVNPAQVTTLLDNLRKTTTLDDAIVASTREEERQDSISAGRMNMNRPPPNTPYGWVVDPNYSPAKQLPPSVQIEAYDGVTPGGGDFVDTPAEYDNMRPYQNIMNRLRKGSNSLDVDTTTTTTSSSQTNTIASSSPPPPPLPPTDDGSSKTKPKVIIASVILGIIGLIIVALLIYAAYKHKKSIDVNRPIVQPVVDASTL